MYLQKISSVARSHSMFSPKLQRSSETRYTLLILSVSFLEGLPSRHPYFPGSTYISPPPPEQMGERISVV